MDQAQRFLYENYRHHIMKIKQNDASYKNCTLVTEEKTLRFQHPEMNREELYQLETELTKRLQQQTDNPVIGMHHQSLMNDHYYFFILQRGTKFYGSTFIQRGEHTFLYSTGMFNEFFNMQVEIGGKPKEDYSFLDSLTEVLRAWIEEQPAYRLYQTTGLLTFKRL